MEPITPYSHYILFADDDKNDSLLFKEALDELGINFRFSELKKAIHEALIHAGKLRYLQLSKESFVLSHTIQ